MKKYIPILLITSLLFSACSIDWNDEKDIKIAELEKQVQDDLFEKKKDCGSMEIDNDIKKNWWEFAKDYSIEEIFYSPIKETCIWVINLQEEKRKNVWLYDILGKDWFLNVMYDEYGFCFFNKDERDESCVQSGRYFEAKIKELKWE